MRILNTDVDLILLALTVVPMVWAVQPPAQQSGGDVALVCSETSCYPAPLVLPEKPGDSR